MKMKLFGFIHRLLAKSSLASRGCVKLRNQVTSVIAHHLGQTADAAHNGEYDLLDVLAPHSSMFVDVGANIGEWTAHMLSRQPTARGRVYEPSIQCAARLRARFDRQGIVVRNIAVGNREGDVSFMEEENFGEGSAITAAHLGTSVGTLRTVGLVTLDHEFPDHETRIDILKIDTEGYDYHVLIGAEHLLTEKRIRFLQFEYNRHWLYAGSTLRDALRFLSDRTYCVLLIRSTGLHPFDYEFWGDFFAYANFFACLPEDLPLVSSLIRRRM
jgi:FkbM family methyltransferase